MQIANVLAAVAVRDLEAAESWYAALFGRGRDAAPMDGLVEWRFPAGGWVQVFADADRAGHTSISLVTDDIEAVRAALHKAGHAIEWSFDGPVTSGAVIRDPDGNRVVFAQSMNVEINPSAAPTTPGSSA